MSEASETDLRWLGAAVRLATPHLGTSGASPTIGAIVIDEARQLVFGRAVTPPGGGISAEAAVLAEVRELSKGRTLYVTMEPPARFLTAKPATDAILKAGIGRVVAGILDPDPAHAGAGLRRLSEAGVTVLHLDHPPSRLLNEGYASRAARNRPFVTLKITLTADGMVGHNKPGQPIPLGPVARDWLERQRAAADAILAGAARATIESSDLTVHLKGLNTLSHLRVMLAGAGPLDTAVELISGISGYPTIVAAAPARELDLRPGIELVRIQDRRGRPNLRPLLTLLAERGINRLLVEAGAGLAESFIAAELVDRLHVLDTPAAIGRGGVPAALLGAFEDRIQAARFSEVDRRALGEDKVRTFERR